MKNFIIIFALGAFSSLAMAPVNLWPVLFLGLGGFYVLLRKPPTPFGAALIGLGFSLGYFGFSLSWIGNALLIENNPYWWAYPLAISGLPLILSLFTAIGCYVYKVICRSWNNDFLSYVVFVLMLSTVDYMRGHLFTGFPWNLYGYTWIDLLPVAQIAALWDIYLLNFLTIFWMSVPAFLIVANISNKVKAATAMLAIFSFTSAYIWGLQRIKNADATEYMPDYGITVVQPNIKQSEKWKAENKIENFLKQIELSKYSIDKNSDNKKAYYIIWPETAISQDLLDSMWAMGSVAKMLGEYPANAYLIAGALRYDRASGSHFNSIVTINNDGKIINIYNKSHLVPFGEYIPFSNIFDIAPIVGFTGFKKGSGRVSIEMPEGLKFSPLICYEIIFSGNVIDRLNKPDFIVNVTNDAWYEGSAGPHQHLVQAKFRAIETGIPVFRSANTGISAVISHLGKSLKQTQQSQNTSITNGGAL